MLDDGIGKIIGIILRQNFSGMVCSSFLHGIEAHFELDRFLLSSQEPTDTFRRTLVVLSSTVRCTAQTLLDVILQSGRNWILYSLYCSGSDGA
jgi:hypothetical protein